MVKPPVSVTGQPVLIIDDRPDPEPRETLALRLTRWGYPVMTATDALSAINLCEKVRPCLIVLGETADDDEVDASTLLHEIADILYEEPPPVALMLREPRATPGRSFVTLSPLFQLEDLLDGADDRCAA